MMPLGLLLLVTSMAAVHSFENNDMYGISHLTYVVTDLAVSRAYYVDVLGGMLVEGLGTGPEGVFGDSHFYRIFQKEIMDARRLGQSLSEVGVPDLSERGDHKVVWEFILFSNSLIQLMQFVNRFTNQVFTRSDPRVGNGFVTSTHAAMMADDRVIALQQIEDIINRQNNIPGYPENKKGFITQKQVNSFAERRSQPLESYFLDIVPPFSLANMRGPNGERWEIAYRRGSGLKPDLGLFCDRKAVFSLMLDNKPKNTFQDTPSKRMAGLSHTNIVTDDFGATVRFYVDVLGGVQNPSKTFKNFSVDDAMQIETFQEEILEAKSLGMTPDESFGIITSKTGPSQSSYDFTFILFDNFYMEPYRFYMNSSYRAVPSSLYRNWSSPAYTNNLHTGFWVKDGISMAKFIKNMEAKSRQFGLYQVLANRAVDVRERGQRVADNQYSDPFPEGHKLQGYDYVYFKGSAGEQLVLTQFQGKARQTLKTAMEKYGALSTAYDSVNPWKWNGFQRTCHWLRS